MEKEYAWFLLQTDLEKRYSGEYIAIVGNSVVAHGKDFKNVLKKAEKKGEEPFIYKVPPKDKLMVV
ncbi:MAG: DUF5678 domain-containing protein [bacterium]